MIISRVLGAIALLSLSTTLFIVAEMSTARAAEQCDADAMPAYRYITPEEVAAAQAAWGQGIVAIGESDAPRDAARKFIDEMYAYDRAPVLFKPTKAKETPFRPTKAKALSYFVGGEIPEDKGFAIAPFTNVRFDNRHLNLKKPVALAIGKYYFTTVDGNEVEADYTFAYIKDEAGKIRIILHHSSLPYDPKKKK